MDINSLSSIGQWWANFVTSAKTQPQTMSQRFAESAVKASQTSDSSAIQAFSELAAQTGGSTGGGVPDSVQLALRSYISPLQAAWSAFGRGITSGNVQDAQSALNSYASNLLATLSSATITTGLPSNSFFEALASASTALSQGHVQGARAAFVSALAARPDSASDAVNAAQNQAYEHGYQAVTTLVQKGSGSLDMRQLTSDIASLNGALRQKNAEITDTLTQSGYSDAEAAKYADAITGVHNGSAAENAQVDATRAQQWMQSLVSLAAQNRYGNDATASALKGAVTTTLAGVLFTNPASWRQLQGLIGATANATTAPQDASSASAGA